MCRLFKWQFVRQTTGAQLIRRSFRRSAVSEAKQLLSQLNALCTVGLPVASLEFSVFFLVSVNVCWLCKLCFFIAGLTSEIEALCLIFGFA